jgi:hypothetical protein
MTERASSSSMFTLSWAELGCFPNYYSRLYDALMSRSTFVIWFFFGNTMCNVI